MMSKPALVLKGAGASVKGAGIGINIYQMNHKSSGNYYMQGRTL